MSKQNIPENLPAQQEISKAKNQSVVRVLFNATIMHPIKRKHYLNPMLDDNEYFTVAHGGGSLLDDKGKKQKYLNCLESFYHFYENGTRIFEYDFVFSKDNKLIGTHKYEYLDGYSKKNPILYDDYLKTKIAGKYTGMTLDTLFYLIKNFPDCKFVIDTKEDDEFKVYEQIIERAEKENIDISKQILPFVTSEKFLNLLENRYNFNEIMFSNYKANYGTKEIVDIIEKYPKINYIHIFFYDFFKLDIQRINRLGKRVFVHMDKYNKGMMPINYGCSGFFSDDINENFFKQNCKEYLLEKFNPKIEKTKDKNKIKTNTKLNTNQTAEQET